MDKIDYTIFENEWIKNISNIAWIPILFNTFHIHDWLDISVYEVAEIGAMKFIGELQLNCKYQKDEIIVKKKEGGSKK